MNVSEEQRLIERMIAGEQGAFDDFFNRFFDRLYRFALQRVGHDTQAAEDAVLQTLCRAMQKIKLYRGEAALFTWLCQICRNTIADSFRSSDPLRAEAVPFEDNDEIRAALESLSALPVDDLEQGLFGEQINHLVHIVLDHLPTRYGEVLELKYIQGLSVKEIAAATHTRPKAIESLLARARVAFRDGITALGEGELSDALAAR